MFAIEIRTNERKGQTVMLFLFYRQHKNDAFLFYTQNKNCFFTTKEIQRTFKRFATDLSVDVPTEAMGILLAVYYQSDLIQQDIAEIVKKNKSSVLRHIDNLEKKNLVQRTIAANDRRRNIINITEKGKQFIDEIHNKANELFGLLSDGLQITDIDTFNSVLSHLQSKNGLKIFI